MIRRCPTLLTVLAVALAFGLALQPVFTRADGIANYTLTTTDALPHLRALRRAPRVSH